MSRYTRRGRLTARMQKALSGGAKVTSGPRGVMVMIGKIGLAMTAQEADDLALSLQAEAEESRRVMKEIVEAERSKEPAAASAP